MSGKPNRGSRDWRRRPGQGRPPGRRTGPAADSLVGTELELDIGPVAHGGSCVARHEGRVVFVRHTLPGEQVRALVTDGGASSRFLRADAVQVLRPSEHRREPACPWSGPGRCGGCDWQHTDAAYGRELKTAVVAEQLHRLAGIDWEGTVEPVPGDVDGLRWRTRVELAVGAAGRPGLRRHRSHEVLSVDDCPISVRQVAGTGVFGMRAPDGVSGYDVAVGSDGTAQLVPLPEHGVLPTVRQEVTAAGRTEAFEVSARGFWQGHPGAASTYVGVVLDLLAPAVGERALDLYCGTGLFTRFLAHAVGPEGSVLGVEGDAHAVSDGEPGLAALPQARIERHDVRRDLASIASATNDRCDLVVLDPPRTGAGREVVNFMAGLRPRAIAYVACDPAALARDLAYAREAGYRTQVVRAFDAYPMTHHVECIALLVPA